MIGYVIKWKAGNMKGPKYVPSYIRYRVTMSIFMDG